MAKNTEERLAQWREYGAKRRAKAEHRAKARRLEISYAERHRNDPKAKARKAANMKRYRNDPQHRPKHEARWQLNRAIASGRIIREPCSICRHPKADGHHADYSKPLVVVWLCRKCHTAEHARATGQKG